MSQIEARTQQQEAGPSRFVSTGASTTLHVGDLDPSVSDQVLHDIFSEIDNAVSVRIVRDKISRQSLGFAYVNYNNAQDATLALESLNFKLVNGKPIRITLKSHDFSGRESGIGNIFIKNLEKSIDSEGLFDRFSTFGNIRSCKVATDNFGQSKGFGYVQFEHQDSAQRAIDLANGMLIDNKKVSVEPFVRREERDRKHDFEQSKGFGYVQFEHQDSAQRAIDIANGMLIDNNKVFFEPFVRREERDGSVCDSKFKNVFVTNFATSTTDEDLRNRFAIFGNIVSTIVMRFGFINFENTDDAAKAVEALNGTKIDGKVWYVEKAKTKSEREVEFREEFELEGKERIQQQHLANNLYIHNLDDTVDETRLRELFAQFGTIKSCRVNRNFERQSKGSGFVRFSTPEEAQCAVANMNQKMVDSKRLYVAPARSKEERRAMVQTSVGVGLPVPTSGPIYHPFTPGIGAQYSDGQSPLGISPLKPTDFLYQQQMFATVRPEGEQNPNFYAPNFPSQNQHSARQLARGLHGPIAPPPQQQHAQQMVARVENRHIRNTSDTRNTQQVIGGRLDGPPAHAGLKLKERLPE